ncbi:autotransporter domain-containing protein [Bradyrhizobium sp. WSM2254]|uniref:autotransporter domain-containing protein n=1 Tax=Bradyrhizobium sp. WSM2254 TaxID=1188263 RepID=UPI0004086670|nr:autotransporter domain-containing protein [Bradyrhizobium sp. WSM2254]
MALLVASTALTATALAPSAHAGTPQWLGTASSNWFIAGNWSGSPPSVPSAADISTTIDTTTPNTAVINGGAAATQQLVIGNSGNGNLAITNGGGLTTSGFGYLGFFANSTGTVSVDGAGSNWDISSGLTVGHSGTGALTITHGGLVTSTGAINIGANAGATGSVLVDGAGSALGLNSTATLSVGQSGNGTLTITNGGTVFNVNASVGTAAGETGSILVDGTGSSWTTTNTMALGGAGKGTLTISNGGTVTTGTAVMGVSPGARGGSAVIDGAGSSWALNTLDVGYNTTGSVAIRNGGLVTSTGPITIGTNGGATGSVLVDGAGSALGLTSNATLHVGDAGTGTLTITNGGTVASANASVGTASGSTGSVLVDGAGSSWITAGVMALGGAGKGTLTISNGGLVSTDTAVMGVSPGARGGSAVIDGAGSSWQVSNLSVGYNTTGSVAVAHGGSMVNINAVIGQNGGSNGSVTVDGAGSSWINQAFLRIGDAGTGSLTIANGGAVSANGQVVIANQAGSIGNLNIGAAPGSAAAAPGTLTAAAVQFGAGTGAINFNHASANYVFAPDIVGNGAVNQLSGTTILTGNNTYTGPTTVNGGTLLVNGSIASSTATVNTGGTLGGIGTVGDTTVNADGMLAPGSNSVGTLTVQGNLVLTSAATYMVQVSGASASQTVVFGAAQLAGIVAVNLTGRVSATTTYTILTSANTIGTFGSVSMTNSAYARNARVSYSGNNVLLTLDAGLLSPSLPGFANINQKSVAAAIDNGLIGGGSMTTGFNKLFNATGQNLLNGLTQASGEAATGTQQGTFSAMGQFLNAMLDPFFGNRNATDAPAGGVSRYAEDGAATRASAGRDAYAAIDKARGGLFAQRWNVWAAGYGGSQTTDGNAVVGSNTATSRIAGVAAGADYQLSPNTVVGFALGGGGTSFSVANGLGGGSSDLFQAGAYARHTMGNAYVAGALAYGWQDVTTDRTVTIAGNDHLRARFNANALSGRVEGGYRYVTPWMGITPYAAAQFTSLYLPGYGEQAISGANTFALNYAGRDVTATRSELGLRTDRSYALETAVLTLRGRAAWAHDFNPDRAISATFQTLPGASFVVNGAASAHDAALLTGAAELKWLNGISLSGTFEGEFSNVTRSYAGKGIARYQW